MVFERPNHIRLPFAADSSRRKYRPAQSRSKLKLLGQVRDSSNRRI